MKKQLLALAFALVMCGSTFAASYYSAKAKGVVGTTSGKDYDYKKAVRVGGVKSLLAVPSSDTYSATQTMPFAFKFFGTAVTEYKVSDNGFLTFNVNETANPKVATTLPSTTAPKNAIFAMWYDFKLATGGGIADQVYSYTYGVAPNRVHVVQWLSLTSETSAILGSFAVRFFEGKHFDIIHNQASGSITGTVGINNADGTEGIAETGSPTLLLDASTNDDQYAAMTVFAYRPDLANELELSSVNIPKYVKKNDQVAIKGYIQNWGTTALTGFKLNYSVDNGTPVVMTLTGLTVSAKGGSYAFEHNAPYFPTAGAASKIKVWVEAPNGGADGSDENNELNQDLYVLNATVPKVVLHEGFTSSTCGPCNPGNANLKNVLNAKLGSWNKISYQVNFPSTGDPYYTAEVGTRFSYYGATFAPWLTVDGDSRWNANTSQGANSNYYTEAYFDTKAEAPGMATIAATFNRVGNTVTVAGTVTPMQAMPQAKLKLRIAIVERTTKKNVKTNGETSFFNVTKKMLPDAAGTALNFSAGTAVTFNQVFTFPGKFRLPADGTDGSIINLATENSVEEWGNLYAVIFVQDDDDQLVWQSFSTDGHLWAVGQDEISDLGLEVFPNPAATSFNVSFGGTVNHGVVRIVDLNGKEVLSQNISDMNGTINCDKLADGLYMVELTAGGKTAVKKLNIIR